jgi:hypothetical protein
LKLTIAWFRPLPRDCCGCNREQRRGKSPRPCAARSQGVKENEIGEDTVGLRDAGHCTLAKMLQFLGNQDRSTLDFVDNRGLTRRIYMGARPMRPKTEVPAWRAATLRTRKNRRRGPARAKTEGALIVVGLLLAFSLIDRAVAQQQPSPSQVGQPQVQILPQSPGYPAPKPYQVTPQTSQPTPMYPQTQPRRQNGR